MIMALLVKHNTIVKVFLVNSTKHNHEGVKKQQHVGAGTLSTQIKQQHKTCRTERKHTCPVCFV